MAGAHAHTVNLGVSAWLDAELVITAVLSMAAYVLFKACEHKLVPKLCNGEKVS